MEKIDKKTYKKTNKQKQKVREKIPVLNILFALLLLTLISSIVFKNRENLQNIFTKKNKIKVPQVSSAADLNIGDIVYYDHKTAENSDNATKQTVEISKGNSKQPGYGIDANEETTFKTKYIWDKYNLKNENYTTSEPYTDYETYEAPVWKTREKTETKCDTFCNTFDKDEPGGDIFGKPWDDAGIPYGECRDICTEVKTGETEEYLTYETRTRAVTKYRSVTKTRKVKGDYIGKVENANKSAYPLNAIKDNYWYQFSGEEKETIQNNNTNNNIQIFNAKDYNTTWRVWDKLSDGRVMLVSNRTVPYEDTAKNLERFTTYGAVGHIWWEHNAHKISSIFGYGQGADISATQGFAYKVGSGIDDAPDMIEGDKGDWKIGEEPQDKISISGARSLTLPEVEEKLGITSDKIKNGFGEIKTNSSKSYGTTTTNTTMHYVVQRDIGSSNQDWTGGDKTLGKAKNKTPGYTMTSIHYYWDKDKITDKNIPNIKYKDMLFNSIDFFGNCLATNTLSVSDGGSDVSFHRGVVDYDRLGTYYSNLVQSYHSNWRELPDSSSLRVAVYLKSKIKYLPDGANAWDIYEASSEDKDLKLKVLNLSSEPSSKIGLEVVKANASGIAPAETVARLVEKKEVSGKIEYTVKAKKFDGQKRDENTTGDNATFSKIDNKYNVEITGIPSGYDFKIIGKTGKQIDLDTDTNLEYELVIYPKAGTQNVLVEYVGGENDPDFAVTGNVVIKFEGQELGRKDNVTLKRGENRVAIENVDLFDSSTNTLKNYTVEFEKVASDKSLHTVAFNQDTKKLVVIYVSPKREITVSVSEDSKKYLTNITEIKLKLVGGEEKKITLKPTDFTTKLTVPERDTSGNVINYSLQKVENIPGYYLSIDGFNVNLKPILKLPFTGTELSGKNIAIISLGIFGIALTIRFRKKLVLIFKEYTMMK